MKKAIRIFAVFLLATSIVSNAQTGTVDSIKFFTDEALISMTLTTDIRQLQTEKKQDVFQPATVSMKFPDSSVIEESIMVGARGKFRRSYCRIPPMMLNFRNTTSPRLNPLGKLKLVIGCGIKEEDEELLLKEFLVYKIYNILEDRSFRVRLLNVNYNDSKGKVKPFSQYAFLIEDDGDMARRNGCRKKADAKFLTEATNRDMMTMVALFQYMIGNTDWAVPNNHNIKLIYERNNEAAPPIVVPYDFDYCGLVNAGYAIPNEIIGTEKVTERVYRGFPRTLAEIQITLDIFRSKKDSILSLVNNFPLLGNRAKKEMINYLEEFFRMINNKGEVKSIFVDNARTS